MMGGTANAKAYFGVRSSVSKQRFAIYFIPDPSSPLWAFGSAVIGYDSAAGRDVSFPSHAVFRSAEAGEWTAAPRKYGFHATLRAPFELADGAAPHDLRVAAEAFARAHAPVELGELVVRELGNFVALVPVSQGEDVTRFASNCVRHFEPLRAPLSAPDRERRLKSKLSKDEIANVETWGYPYVHDAFRFHMTLTGPLPGPVRERMRDALATLYAPISAPIRIDAIGLCRQADRQSRFEVVARLPLAGSKP